MDEKWEDRQEQLRMREYTQNLAGGRLLLRWGRGRSDFHLLDRRTPPISKVLEPRSSGVHTEEPHRHAAGCPPLTSPHALSLPALGPAWVQAEHEWLSFCQEDTTTVCQAGVPEAGGRGQIKALAPPTAGSEACQTQSSVLCSWRPRKGKVLPLRRELHASQEDLTAPRLFGHNYGRQPRTGKGVCRAKGCLSKGDSKLHFFPSRVCSISCVFPI